MEFNISNSKNIAGMAALMNSNSNNDREILELERQIISGADLDLEQEQIHELEQYKSEMERLSNSYNINERPMNEPETDGDDFLLPMDNQLSYMTMEQKKQTHVDNVLKDIDDDNNSLEIDIDRECDDDEKNELLNQIDMLRDTLEDDGIELKNIPIVTKNSSISDIKNIYKVLRLKNDRNRYCSFAEELILAGAYGIEHLFDGKNEWFGNKPSLVGWSNTVRIKLRRCRFETSTLVKEIIQDYNMGAGIRLALELIPSIFLYSRNTKLASKEGNDDEYNTAISNLNNLN